MKIREVAFVLSRDLNVSSAYIDNQHVHWLLHVSDGLRKLCAFVSDYLYELVL
jgi:hypothetical protein